MAGTALGAAATGAATGRGAAGAPGRGGAAARGMVLAPIGGAGGGAAAGRATGGGGAAGRAGAGTDGAGVSAPSSPPGLALRVIRTVSFFNGTEDVLGLGGLGGAPGVGGGTGNGTGVVFWLGAPGGGGGIGLLMTSVTEIENLAGDNDGSSLEEAEIHGNPLICQYRVRKKIRFFPMGV